MTCPIQPIKRASDIEDDMKNLSLKNRPVKDAIIQEAQAIPSQISSAFEIASGSGTKYVLGNILNTDELCDNSAQQIWAENQYLEKQPLYVIELEFWELESEQLDWSVSQLFYTKYRILVSEKCILKNEVVTGPGQFSWQDIEELQEHYISIDDEHIPEEVFPQITSIILEHFHEDYGTDDYVSDVIEPMLEETNADEAEKELISSVFRPLRSEFKKFITQLKQQVNAEREVRARHPVFDPESFSIFKEELLTCASLKAWASEFKMLIIVTNLSNAEALSELTLTLFRKGMHFMAPTRELKQIKCVVEKIYGTTSAENLLNELFVSGWIEKIATDDFKEHLSS